MTRRYGWMLAIVVLGAAVALAAAADKIQVSHPKGQDLSTLKDGETRSFGEGKAQVTATRHGDVVELNIPGEDGDQSRTLTCKVGSEHCFVMSHDDLGHGTVMIVKREGEGADDSEAFSWTSEDGDAGTWTTAGAHGKTIVLQSPEGGHEIHVVADTDGEPGAAEVIVVGGDDDGGGFKMLSGTEGGPHAIRIELKGKMLRCPEGDATMTVDEGDDAVYLCPKHNVAMEKSDGTKEFERHIEVHQKTPDKE